MNCKDHHGIVWVFLITAMVLCAPATAQTSEGEPPVVSVGEPRGVITDYRVVNFMRSTTAAATNSNLNVSTAVNIVNLNATTCTLEVRFFRNFSSSAACTVSRSVSAGQSVTFCSRDVGARDDFIACSNVCDPELEFHQGRAIVTSADNCSALGVAGLLLFTDSNDSTVQSISSVASSPLN